MAWTVVVTGEVVEELRPVDGLCPGCWLPSLMAFTLALHMHTTTRLTTLTACADCGMTVR